MLRRESSGSITTGVEASIVNLMAKRLNEPKTTVDTSEHDDSQTYKFTLKACFFIGTRLIIRKLYVGQSLNVQWKSDAFLFKSSSGNYQPIENMDKFALLSSLTLSVSVGCEKVRALFRVSHC